MDTTHEFYPSSRRQLDCVTDCDGACCRAGVAIPLHPAEAERLRAVGTSLTKMQKNEWRGNKPGRRRDFYFMESDCGQLDQETGLCSDYDNRPVICREFKAGSFVCSKMRERAAQPVPVELSVHPHEVPASQSSGII